MADTAPTPIRWITVRLDDDYNWWLHDTSAELSEDTRSRGVLDPRQVAHLVEAFDEFRKHGLRPQHIADAFQLFEMESELAEGVVRLSATNADIFADGAQLFALPRIQEEGAGAYYEFLDVLSAARIHKLNATHHYAYECTEDEMQDELDALDADRYFSSDTIHAFDEINEILEWSPAEWDDSSS